MPQRRRRAIVLATRGLPDFKWPEPTHERKPVRDWDALADVEVLDPPIAYGKWSGLLPTIPEGHNYLWHTPRGQGRPLFGYRTRFWSFLLKLSKAQPSWTLPAQPGPSTGPFHWDSRPLTAQESLRLQTFPVEWYVSGQFRDQIRQIGNRNTAFIG